MKWYGLGVAIAVALALSAIVFSGGPKTDSPTHVVAVFLDGYDHGDFRQACAVQKPVSQPMVACEQFYVGNVAQGLQFGRWGGYKVVPHSARVWRQAYRGGYVELAVVRFVYAPQGGQALVAHLRLTRDGWRIWAIQ